MQAQINEQPAGHVAAPEGEFDSFNLFDSCQRCGQPIRLDDAGAWVTMLGFNRECYGRRAGR